MRWQYDFNLVIVQELVSVSRESARIRDLARTVGWNTFDFVYGINILLLPFIVWE